ncbi:MAG: glycoside hydrolase family 5 protein [Deltaproteobacteria bacterium]|nr:glycoside hydrolase family 5 protein [Deltaproteobacteria bacterium]
MSFGWSQWWGQYWTAGTVFWLVDDWKVEIVRASMGIESGGYLTTPATERARVVTVVDEAIARGIYVIIDWHDHNAPAHVSESRAFFTDMAQRYGQYPNVIYEIFNEPEGETWAEIKAYAQDIVGAIRAENPDNIVVVGTPNWSQQVDQAAADPVPGTNLAYTLHFYAATHKQWLRDTALTAMNAGIALFVRGRLAASTSAPAGSGRGGFVLRRLRAEALARHGPRLPAVARRGARRAPAGEARGAPRAAQAAGRDPAAGAGSPGQVGGRQPDPRRGPSPVPSLRRGAPRERGRRPPRGGAPGGRRGDAAAPRARAHRRPPHRLLPRHHLPPCRRDGLGAVLLRLGAGEQERSAAAV